MTSSINQYRRTVGDYLRQAYGIVPILRVDGKHSKYIFDYDGEPRTIILNDRNGAGGSNAAEMKLQDIRRELGEPSWQKTTTAPTTLAIMTQQLNVDAKKLPPPPKQETISNETAVAPTALGKVSIWASNKMLCLAIPMDIRAAFGHDGPCKVDFTYPDTFVIRKAQVGAPIRSNNRLVVSGVSIGKRLGLFEATDASFVIVNSTIVARLIEQPRHAIPITKKIAKKVKPVPQPDTIDEPATDPALQPDKTNLRWQENPMLEALRLINKIETTTDYRLHSTEVNGKQRWVFRAPDIGLE